MEQQNPEHIPQEIEIPAAPKSRKLPKLYSVLAILVLLATLGYFLGRAAWFCVSDVLAFGKPDRVVTVTVTEEDDLQTVSRKLAEAGLIRYPALFRLFGKVTNAAEKIGAGTFELNHIYDYPALIRAMRPEK